MDNNRFEVVYEKDGKQHAVRDRLENRVVVRYASKEKADKVCKDLNDNFN